MLRNKTGRKYEVALRTDAVDDQNKAVSVILGTQSATLTRRTIFKAPSMCKVTKITLVVEADVAAHATNKWAFQVTNEQAELNLLATAKATTVSDGGPMTAYSPFVLTPDQNVHLNDGDVLTLTATKSNSAPNLTVLSATVEYTVDGINTTSTSTSSTTTTTTTTSTTTTTTTTSSSTTSTTTTTTSTTTTTTSSSTTSTTTTSSSTSSTTTVT